MLEIIETISKNGFDIEKFVQLVITNDNARNVIVRNMLTNPAIMVYYHCYYIVERSSQEHPELYYPYWDDIAQLLHHKNSYHRDFALEIIGNLLAIDIDDRFNYIQEDYYKSINDEKFMTGNLLIKNLQKVFNHKADHRTRIINILLDIDNQCDYSEKQKALLKADILEIFENVYSELSDRAAVEQFIRAEAHSVSPKTRKKAKSLIQMYHLQDKQK